MKRWGNNQKPPIYLDRPPWNISTKFMPYILEILQILHKKCLSSTCTSYIFLHILSNAYNLLKNKCVKFKEKCLMIFSVYFIDIFMRFKYLQHQGKGKIILFYASIHKKYFNETLVGVFQLRYSTLFSFSISVFNI